MYNTSEPRAISVESEVAVLRPVVDGDRCRAADSWFGVFSERGGQGNQYKQDSNEL